MTPPPSAGDDAAPARLSSQHVVCERLKMWAHFSKPDENLAQCSICQKVVVTTATS